jgi:hypothetical protein
MTADVDVCNMALAHLSAGKITTLADSTPQARYCSMFYDAALETMLTDGTWKFAKVIADLVLDGTGEGENGWIYKYTYPTDCLRVICIRMPNDVFTSTARYGSLDDMSYVRAQLPNLPHDRVGTLLMTDVEDAQIEYIQLITADDMSSMHQLALSYLLASLIAVPLIGTEKGSAEKKRVLEMYTGLSTVASTRNSSDQYEIPRESDFVTALRN